MQFIQSDMVQWDWVQDGAEVTEIFPPKAPIPFELYNFANQLQSFDILKDWFAQFRLPSFKFPTAIISDEDVQARMAIKSSFRDKNIVQTSNAVLHEALLETQRVAKYTELLRIELFVCLDQACRVVRVHTAYLMAINVVLTETGRIFLAGSFSMRQLETETKAKDELWNLNATNYGCLVMASILKGGKWALRTPEKTTYGKTMSVLSWGATGAMAGSAIGPIGTAVGAVVGIIVGIALEFL